MDKDLISKAMAELGKKSAEARKKKDPNYMKEFSEKGAAARRIVKHQNGTKSQELVQHKGNYNCGLPNCPVKTNVAKKHQASKKSDMTFTL